MRADVRQAAFALDLKINFGLDSGYNFCEQLIRSTLSFKEIIMRAHSFILAITLCFAAASTPAIAGKYKKAGNMSVDSSFFNWGINWSGGGKYDAKLKLREQNGMVVLCGAGVLTGGTDSRFNTQALNATYMTLNGRTIIKGFRYFANARTKKKLPRALANCRYTSARAPLKASDTIDIKQTTNVFRE